MTDTGTVAPGDSRGCIVAWALPDEQPAWVKVTMVREVGDWVRLTFRHPTGGHMTVEVPRSARLILRPGRGSQADTEAPGLF